MKKTLMIAALMIASGIFAHAQFNLIPQPRKLELKSEARVKPKATVSLPLYDTISSREAYSINITPERIEIRSNSSQGQKWAERTLAQLCDENDSYPCVAIEDWPEFPIRAFMYDSGRNFIEVEQVEQFIDLISAYKLNAFHWHLTDKPAWRIESRAYPQLNDAKYQRPGRDEGRFYSYADIRHIMDYARERGVMIIPEIDMPGHSDYFNATFGTSMNTPQGMAILSDCLKEFFDEFSAEEMPYIHIGSDEIHIDNPDEFMAWAVKQVEDAGRIPIVWNPGLDAGDTAIYQIWRDGLASPETGDDGKKILDSYMGYLNYVDPLMSTNRMFLHAPCSTGKSSPTELGGILCLWNDVRVDDNTRIPIHNGMMGGVLPFAERFWLGGKPEQSFRDVLRPADDADMKRLMEFQQRMAAHKQKYLPEMLEYWQPNSPLTEWDLTLTDSVGNIAYRGKAYGDVIDFSAICAELGIDDNLEATITRTYIADNDTVVECRIGFDASARSNRLSDGIAQQGEWENYGKVSVNGENILPPKWDQPGMYRFHYNTWAQPEEELPFTDEQFYWTRHPVILKLHKGYNTITLTTKKHFNGQRFQAAMLGL